MHTDLEVEDSVAAYQSVAGVPPWVRAIDRLSFVLLVPAVVALLALLVHIIADVVARTYFNAPLPSTLEIVANWWMVIAVLPAMGFALLSGDQIRATLLSDALPKGMKKANDVLALALLAVLGAFFTYYGWKAAVESWSVREAAIGKWHVPIWPMKFGVPLAGVVLILQSASESAKVLLGVNTERATEL